MDNLLTHQINFRVNSIQKEKMNNLNLKQKTMLYEQFRSLIDNFNSASVKTNDVSVDLNEKIKKRIKHLELKMDVLFHYFDDEISSYLEESYNDLRKKIERYPFKDDKKK